MFAKTTIPEPLESRIAPAAVFQYTDVDSDLVTVKLAIGTIADLVAALTFSSTSNGPRQLQLVNLENLESPLQSLTITAVPQNGLGDGFVNVGAITTSGSSYGSFVVDGDLGGIFGLPTNIDKVVVHSLGALGVSTQLAGIDNTVEFTGRIGTLKVARDLAANVFANSIGTLKVGGSILGLGGNAGGVGIVSTGGGRIDTVVVGGTLAGGSSLSSGSILAGSFGSVTVGTMRGGSGNFSGGVFSESGDIDRIVIKGDVIGGLATVAQQMIVEGKVKSLRIEGSIIGGGGTYAGDPGDFGQLFAHNGFGKIVVLHDIVGGNTAFSGSIVSGTDAGATTPQTLDGTMPIGTIVIGGSIRGGGGDGSAAIFCNGVKSVNVKGSIRGGSGALSGELDLADNAALLVTVGGDIEGGAGANSGRITGGNQDALALSGVTVRGSLIGGLGPNSGHIDSSQGGFAQIVIGGHIEGGIGVKSGGVNVAAPRGVVLPVSVGGDVRGGGGADSGFIDVRGFPAVTIGGSVQAGAGPRSGFVELQEIAHTVIKGSIFGGANNAGHINGDDTNGTLTILGSVLGLGGTARITAKGDVSFAGSADVNAVAFTRLTIVGDVFNAEILAGYDFDSSSGALIEVTPDVQLGKVQIGGDWIQSSLVAGVDDGVDNRFGSGDDALIVPTNGIIDDPAIKARIASVVVGGSILGIPGGSDSFGFVAQEIAAFRYGKNKLPRTPDFLDPALPVAPTADVFVRELA